MKNKKEKKERKLTLREQERYEKMLLITKQKEEEGYQRKDFIISLTLANVLVFVLLIPVGFLFVFWFIKANPQADIEFHLGLFFFVIILALSAVHELIHGLVWGLSSGKGFEVIEFGFVAEQLAPYCTCKEPLKKNAYLLGSIMPTVILGIIPTVLGVYIASIDLLFIGIMMTLGGMGDIMVVIKLLRYDPKGKDIIIMDHPTEGGFIVFERDA